MRLRNIIQGIKDNTIKYVISHDGKSRKERRAEAAEARRGGPKRTKPRNWSRDKHKRRKEQNRRRMQRWRK